MGSAGAALAKAVTAACVACHAQQEHSMHEASPGAAASTPSPEVAALEPLIGQLHLDLLAGASPLM